MKIVLAVLLTLTSITAFAQTDNDLVRVRRVPGTGFNQGYHFDECTADGMMGYNKSVEREVCLNFSNDMEIDRTTTPWTIKIIGLDENTASIGTLLTIIADLESTIATLQDAVATLDSDLGDLTTEVDGKFDIPTGTDMECVRGDGSVGACP